MTGNGLAVGCQLSYRKIHGYFYSAFASCRLNRHAATDSQLPVANSLNWRIGIQNAKLAAICQLPIE